MLAVHVRRSIDDIMKTVLLLLVTIALVGCSQREEHSGPLSPVEVDQLMRKLSRPPDQTERDSTAALLQEELDRLEGELRPHHETVAIVRSPEEMKQAWWDHAVLEILKLRAEKHFWDNRNGYIQTIEQPPERDK